MPYVDQKARRELDFRVRGPYTAGELNYQITQLFLAYVKHAGTNYQTFADIEAAGQGALREFYRRKVAPYEDNKLAQNGDIDGYQSSI